MDAKTPGGCFTTFSVFDPHNPAFAEATRPHKRNRKVYVCIPCHERKLKCNRQLPCQRCEDSGLQDECRYQKSSRGNPRKEAPSETVEDVRRPPCVEPSWKSENCYVASSEKCHRVNGTTHWRTVISVFEEACPFIFGYDSQWSPRYNCLKELRHRVLFPDTPGTSLGHAMSPFSVKYEILANLPSKPIVEALVESYLSTFDVTHPLLQSDQFRDEISRFWTTSDRTPSQWLSQLCFMSALGCQSADSRLLEGTGRTAVEWTSWFLEAAQLAFRLSGFATAPDLTTVRVLCMMALTRQCEIANGSHNWDAQQVMNILRQVAILLQLPDTLCISDRLQAPDVEARKRLWITIQVLDLDLAMRTGTPPIFVEQQSNALCSGSITGTSEAPSCNGQWDTCQVDRLYNAHIDIAYQVVLSEILPLLQTVIKRVNSPSESGFGYDTVISLDQRFHLLYNVRDVFSVGGFLGQGSREKASIERQFLEVLIHRTLLALHHSYIPVHVRSQYRVINSAMSLLAVQGEWAGTGTTGAFSDSCSSSSSGSSMGLSPDEGWTALLPSAPHDWLLDLCHDDFSIAILYIILAKRRSLAGDLPVHRDIATGATCLAGRRSHDILAARLHRSVAHLKEAVGVIICCGCLMALETKASLLQKTIEITDCIESLMVEPGTYRRRGHDTCWGFGEVHQHFALQASSSVGMYLSLVGDCSSFQG